MGDWLMEKLTGNLLQEVQAGPADPRHANWYSYGCLALIVSGVSVGSVCVEHLGAQHIISKGWQVERGLSVLKTSQISVCSSLQEHAAVRVIAFDDGVSEQEAVLNVDVGTVVQEDPHTAGALADNSQLQRRGPFVTERVHFRPELEEEANERVSTVVSSNMQWRPAIVAFCIYDITAELRLQH